LILALQQLLPHARMLIIMYSKSLQVDAESRFPCGNITIRTTCPARLYTLHGFFRSMYGECPNDLELKKLLDGNAPRRRPFDYEYVIVDECQDLTELFQSAVFKILADNDNPNPVTMKVGDRLQEIFGFLDADARFLLGGDEAYALFSSRPWKRVVLKTTYRLNDEHCEFMNRNILNETCFASAGRPGPKPILIKCNLHTWWHRSLKIRDKHVHVRNRRGLRFAANEVLVLAPSIRGAGSKTPIRKLANWFSENKLAVSYQTGSSDEDPSTVEGKVTFCSFHQAKGMEKRLVIVLGADEGWYEGIFGKDISDRTEVPCCWVVALTRAKDQLIMVQNEEKEPLPFGNWDSPTTTYDLWDFSSGEPQPPRELDEKKLRTITVSELLRHQPWYDMDAARELVKMEHLPKAK